MKREEISLATTVESRKATTAVLAAMLLIGVAIVSLAPTERTLGSGIRVVYVHVALIWTGILGLGAAGLLGLATAVFPHPALLRWLRAISWVGFGFFVAGTAVSLWAEVVNWGAIFWQEPRTAAILQVVAAGVIVQVAQAWRLNARLLGLLHLALAGFMFWAMGGELVLHPGDPVGASDAWGIRFTFYGLFALSAGAALWLTLHLWRRQD
jgi:hypothetical protein